MLVGRFAQQIGLRGQVESLTCGATLISKRFYRFWPETESTTAVFMPPNLEDRKIPQVPHIPQQVPEGVELPYKHIRADDDMRGPERVHNQLIYRKFGLIALGGGGMQGCHFDIIKGELDRNLDIERFFATWRVDPPWKPVSKKSLGKRRGGGKTKVHHYETPVKAGRIIFEVAGIGQYGEVHKLLNSLAVKMPFYAMPISQQIMDDLAREKMELDAKNFNPFEYREIIRKDYSNSQRKLSPKEMYWGGTYF